MFMSCCISKIIHRKIHTVTDCKMGGQITKPSSIVPQYNPMSMFSGYKLYLNESIRNSQL